MPRFTKDDVTVETAVPTEIVALRSQGFVEHVAKTAEVKHADAEAAKTTGK
jgi:hypothetical protein